MGNEAANLERPKRVNWLAGRSDRREYWAYIGILFGLTIVLSVVLPNVSNYGATPALVIIQIRRFHDMGRSGWWAAALLAAQFAVMLPILFALPDTGIVVVALIGLGVIVAMGAIPGQPHENRFGPPRGKRGLKEIFS